MKIKECKLYIKVIKIGLLEADITWPHKSWKQISHSKSQLLLSITLKV